MAVYDPTSLGITPPAGGFQEGGWYGGRQYIGGTLSDPGVIHPGSSQVGAGQAVSEEVNKQSAAAQNVPHDQFTKYLQDQRQQSAGVTPAPQPAPAPTRQTELPSGTAGAGLGTMTAPETPNLPEMYKSLIDSSGVKQKEEQLAASEKQFLEERNKITDNPFLTAGIMDQRLRRLKQAYEKETAPLRSQIEMAKADVETQLNLQSRQIDINSNAVQLALNWTNTLLGMGALDNASGEDIAAITRTTGISSSMIQSAIAANKAKNIETSVSTWSDGTNDYFVTVDQSGNIVNRQLIGPSSSGSGFSGADFLSGLLGGGATTDPVLDSIINEVVTPTYSPSMGIGSWYVDELGRSWQYESSGWALRG